MAFVADAGDLPGGHPASVPDCLALVPGSQHDHQRQPDASDYRKWPGPGLLCAKRENQRTSLDEELVRARGSPGTWGRDRVRAGAQHDGLGDRQWAPFPGT